MKLSPRLAALAGLVPPCNYAADIGSDHGLLPAFLLENGICRGVAVTDLSAPSLEKAKDLFRRRGLSADFAAADGLKGLSRPADAIVIAGMGGQEIIRILKADPAPARSAVLVLQPMKNARELRLFLTGNGFEITRERVAREGRRFYQMFVARAGEQTLSEAELWFGRHTENTPELSAFLDAREQKLRNDIRRAPGNLRLRAELSALCEVRTWLT